MTHSTHKLAARRIIVVRGKMRNRNADYVQATRHSSFVNVKLILTDLHSTDVNWSINHYHYVSQEMCIAKGWRFANVNALRLRLSQLTLNPSQLYLAYLE